MPHDQPHIADSAATDRREAKAPGWLGTPWFARRRLGWGYRPASWQGWALTVLFVLFVFSANGMLRTHHVDLFAGSLVALCVAYIGVAAMTSRAL